MDRKERVYLLIVPDYSQHTPEDKKSGGYLDKLRISLSHVSQELLFGGHIIKAKWIHIANTEACIAGVRESKKDDVITALNIISNTSNTHYRFTVKEYDKVLETRVNSYIREINRMNRTIRDIGFEKTCASRIIMEAICGKENKRCYM